MVWVFYGLICGGIAFGIVKALTVKVRYSAYNQRLKLYLDGRDTAFKEGILQGRNWLAEFIAEAERVLDLRDDYLKNKKHPARKAAKVVSEVKKEKKELQKQYKFLEYQLKSYEEYFPVLVDFRDAILDETIPLSANAANAEGLESADPTTKFLSNQEWNSLDETERNQLALDRYVDRPKANWEIGRFYERYLGYLREQEGWDVAYFGALKGFEDLGRDLICKRDKVVEIIQAKCWSASKTIHEKHVFQLYGTTLLYRMQNPTEKVTPVLVVTTELSEVANKAAEELGVRVELVPLKFDYPKIKCNINRSTGERIYHLPFDQQYDRVKIDQAGECYVMTVAEADELGFRRAWRFKGTIKAN
ncbi:MAG: restriction endonuclease [Desulfarculaceae bacterium]|nr:restriction endonuclease [Desulfarculaceae bacterium]